MNGNEQSNVMGWVIGGLIVLIIIAVAWFMFAGTGDRMETATENELEETAQELEEESEEAEGDMARAAARAEARTRLLALETRLAAEENYSELATETAEIRADLAAAYEDAEGMARTEWETTIEPAFADFESALREGTADTADFFADLLLTLEADVRTDEE